MGELATRLAQLEQEAKELAELEYTELEQKAVDYLVARIRVNDPDWGDSLNDEDAIRRVILAARKGK